MLRDNGSLADFDAEVLELLLLVAAPRLQSLALQTWTLLSRERSSISCVISRFDQFLLRYYGAEVSNFDQPVFNELRDAMAVLKKNKVKLWYFLSLEVLQNTKLLYKCHAYVTPYHLK